MVVHFMLLHIASLEPNVVVRWLDIGVGAGPGGPVLARPLFQ